MRKIVFFVFLFLLFATSIFAEDAAPYFSVPPTLEVYANGLRSLAFVVKVEGVSPEAEQYYNYFVDALPAHDPPIFNKKDRMFYWRPRPNQAGKYNFKFTALDLSGKRYEKNVDLMILPAPSPEALPRGWVDMRKPDKYLVGKKYLPSTNIIDFDISSKDGYEIEIKIKDSLGEDCILRYLSGDGQPQINKFKNTAVIPMGKEYASEYMKKVRRDLYEDLYNYLEMIYKNIESISIKGSYTLSDCKIYDEKSLLSAAGGDEVDLPSPNISFDDRFYVIPIYSKQNPILISDTPKIQIDFNTRSGVRWRAAKLKINEKKYFSVKDDFTLIVVKPYRDITPFDVDYVSFILDIPAVSKLAFGEHHIVFEVENAYGMTLAKEAYARVVSLPSQIVGKPVVYPNPFSPVRDGEARIQYKLSVQTNIDLILIAVDGTIVSKRKFFLGDEGAKKGLNTVKWNGLSDAGLRLPNGIYSAIIIDRDENRILDKFKLTIYQ